MAARAFITGLAGPALTADERAFLREAQPWGLILFKRNIEDKAQVTALGAGFREASAAPTRRSWSIRRAAGCSGSARRIGRPIRPARPMARLYDRDRRQGLRGGLAGRAADRGRPHAARHRRRLPAARRRAGARRRRVIGDRAYGETPDQVAALAAAVAEGLLDGGVLPVLKHIPGHGRANADSHLQPAGGATPTARRSKPPISPHSGR